MQDLEDDAAQLLLNFEIISWWWANGCETPPLLPDRRMPEIVLGASFRVIEHPVCVVKLTETFGITGFLIVRMETLREQSEDTLDRVRFRTWTNLQRLVVVG